MPGLSGTTSSSASSLRAVGAVSDAINEPRYPSLKGIMGAKKKPQEILSLADLGIDASDVGESGSRTQVLALADPPAAAPAAFGLVGSCRGQRPRSASKALAFGMLVFAAGFAAPATWETRHLTASVASGALKNIARVRDERWFEQNPIDYARPRSVNQTIPTLT